MEQLKVVTRTYTNYLGKHNSINQVVNGLIYFLEILQYIYILRKVFNKISPFPINWMSLILFLPVSFL